MHIFYNLILERKEIMDMVNSRNFKNFIQKNDTESLKDIENVNYMVQFAVQTLLWYECGEGFAGQCCKCSTEKR